MRKAGEEKRFNHKGHEGHKVNHEIKSKLIALTTGVNTPPPNRTVFGGGGASPAVPSAGRGWVKDLTTKVTKDIKLTIK
jgi:hypothetical protein